MTIAHVLYGLSMGGIETMLVNITHFQAEMGHDIHIVVINDIFDESLIRRIDPAVKLHKIGRKQGSRNPWPVIKMNFCLMRIRPDVIHLHYASISHYIIIPSLKDKLCNTLHDMCNPNNTRHISKAGPVFSISESVKNDLYRYCGISATTVRNGIMPSTIKVRDHKRTKLNPFRIIQIARLDHNKKGQDILIDSVSRVSQKGYEIELTFIGDGPSMDYIRGLADGLTPTIKVKFLGNQSQDFIFRHLCEYDLLVHPSRIEGFGLTVAEAMAAKLPVLVSDNDGPMEIIDNGRYGSFFKREDSESCANEIIEIINNYPSDDELESSRKHILEEYNVEITTLNYLKSYEMLIHK